MNSLEGNFISWLKADAGVIAAVSNRVFKGIPRKGAAYPQLCWLRVGTTRTPDLSGQDPLPRQRLQIDAWALKEGQERDLADYLAGLLQGLLTVLPGGKRVCGSLVENDADRTDPPQDAPGLQEVFRSTLDVLLWIEG